jgi:hypothetical protein
VGLDNVADRGDRKSIRDIRGQYLRSVAALILRGYHTSALEKESEAHAGPNQTSRNDKPDQGSRTIRFHLPPFISFLRLQAAARP